MSYIIYQNNLSIHWYIKATCRTYIKTTYHIWYSKTTCLVYIETTCHIYTKTTYRIHLFIKTTCHTFIPKRLVIHMEYQKDMSYIYLWKWLVICIYNKTTYICFFFFLYGLSDVHNNIQMTFHTNVRQRIVYINKFANLGIHFG